MINALALIIGLQVIGTVLVDLSGLPVPGPVMGMVLFLAGLLAFNRVGEDVDKVARFFLANLSLLFVPAAVGIIRHLDLVNTILWQLALVLFVSLCIGLGITALVFVLLSRRLSPPNEKELRS